MLPNEYTNTVLQGDCNEVLPALPEGIVQTVFVDPPYNIGVDYGDGPKADKLPPEQYLANMEAMIRESVKRLSERGSIWVLINEPWADEFGLILKDVLPRRNRIIWRETFGQYGESRFPNGHRHLFWHVKDMRSSPFHTEDIRIPSQRMEVGDKRANGPRVPDDVWEIPRLVGNARERIGCLLCQLPEQLLKRVIHCSSQPSDLVMDPMAGTGTTLRVAQTLGRNYLGIEKQANQVAAITKRLRNAYQMPLFS